MKKSLCRRFLAFGLSLIVAGSFMVTASAADGKYGDVNGDNLINSADALQILKHSVGSSKIDSSKLVWADVTGEGEITSMDALDILMVTVGKKAKFAVEINIEAPATKNEMLNLYANAVSKARQDIPSYRLKYSTNTKDSEVSGPLLVLIGKEAAEELEKELTTNDSYQNLFAQGTTGAINNLPVELTVKDYSKYKSIAFQELSDGNYKVIIDFKNESNPKAGSTIVKVMNLPDYETMKKQFEEQMNGMNSEVPMTVTLNSMEYQNCRITCVVDSTTGEIISLVTTSDMVVEMEMNVGLAMDVKTTTTTVAEYSNFSY